MWAKKEPEGEITEGGITQRQKEIKKKSRESQGFLCVSKWDRKSATPYTHLRCNKGNLLSWRYKIRKGESDLCRWWATEEETGEHIVFKCPHWKTYGVERQVGDTNRTWQTWEDLGLRKVWTDKGGEGDKDIYYVYKLFSNWDLTWGGGNEKGWMTWISLNYVSFCKLVFPYAQPVAVKGPYWGWGGSPSSKSHRNIEKRNKKKI